MTKWVLLITMLGQANYNYNPTTVGGFSTKESCEKAARTYIKGTFSDRQIRVYRPKTICIKIN